MRLFNSKKTSTFWINIMDELSRNSEDPSLSYKILSELCEFFDFGFSFIYHADHKGLLNLDTYFSRRKNDIPIAQQVDIKKALGEDYFNLFLNCKLIYASDEKEKTILEKKIVDGFNAPTMLLFPIKADNGELQGLIGLGDKREKRREEPLNKQFTYSVLILISNYVKLQINMKNIELTEKALESIADNLGVDIYVNDIDNYDILYTNKSMAEPYGGSDAILGMKCYKALYTNRKAPCEYCPKEKIFDEEGNPTKVYTWDYQRPFDGSWFKVLCTGVEWDEKRKACIISSIDITEQKQLEESIEKMADYDALTGLPNKHKLFMDMQKLIEEKKDFYLLFMDVNKFKDINDKYGHRTGDELLKNIGEFLMEIQTARSTAYRYAGDEFAIIIKTKSKSTAVRKAKKIEKRGKQRWMVLNQKLMCVASIGIAAYPEHGKTREEVLENADKAMYVSKEKDGKITFFNYKKMASKKAENIHFE